MSYINDLVRVRGDRKRRECVFERDRGARHFARVGREGGGDVKFEQSYALSEAANTTRRRRTQTSTGKFPFEDTSSMWTVAMQVDTKIINVRCEIRARHDRRIHFSAVARRPHPSIPQLTKRQKAKTSDMVLQCSANFISL